MPTKVLECVKVVADSNEDNSQLLEPSLSGSIQTEQSNLISSNMVYAGQTYKKFPQYLAGLSAAGGALALGTLLGWTSPAQKELVAGDYGFPVSDDQFSWIGSAMTLGAACVCMPIGFLISMIGRKPTMLLLLLPFTLGWCLLIWAQNVGMMYAARFILGVSGGAFSVTAPMYTGEIAHKDIRGTLGSFFQLMNTAGILFVYVVGAGLNVFWLSIVCGLLPTLNALIFVFMPESPSYLVTKNNTESAIQSIIWLRGVDYDYHSEINELRETESKIKEKPMSIGTALKRATTLKALGISLGLMFFQQMSGINAVIFYSTDIFRDANTGLNENVATILVGTMQVVATFVSVLVVDKAGRRVLLLASAIVMSIATLCMGVYFYMQEHDAQSVTNMGWLPVCSLCIFIVMFSLGFGPIPWLMMGELFTSDVKGMAGSMASTTNWLLAFIVTKTFVNLKMALGAGQTFWLFTCVSIAGFIFVFFLVPETKGKSFNEIQDILEGRNSSRSVVNAAKNTQKN